MLKRGFWKLFYPGWKNPDSKELPSYTLLLPVPGDLPVFLKLALDVCRKQDISQIHEVLVIPDRKTKGFKKAYAECIKSWPEGKVRLVCLRKIDKAVIAMTNNPGHIHWMQLVRGADEVKTKYALLHDSDLFLKDSDVFKDLYERIRIGNLKSLGIQKAWDPWFGEHGYNHVVSTWEIFFSVSWLKQFKPWQLHGRVATINDKRHVFDTMLWAQCMTPADQVGLEDISRRVIHFNYVISTYRWFQKGHGSFEDENFRLLLIRLLHESICEGDEDGCEIPSVEFLAKGIKSKEPTPVTYRTTATWNNFTEFRAKLQGLLDSSILDRKTCDTIQDKILPFDKAFFR